MKPQKVFKLRHKPTGLYYGVNRTFTNRGKLFRLLPRADYFTMNVDKYFLERHPELKYYGKEYGFIKIPLHEWEVEVYELVLTETRDYGG